MLFGVTCWFGATLQQLPEKFAKHHKITLLLKKWQRHKISWILIYIEAVLNSKGADDWKIWKDHSVLLTLNLPSTLSPQTILWPCPYRILETQSKKSSFPLSWSSLSLQFVNISKSFLLVWSPNIFSRIWESIATLKLSGKVSELFSKIC